MTELHKKLEQRLDLVIADLERQRNVASSYLDIELSYTNEMKQLREWVNDVGEYEIAYESIVASIEKHPFVLQSKSIIALLEVGLLLGYKTDRIEDKIFDRRGKK